MEFFKSFLRVIGLLQPAKVDFISELPPEVSQLILRNLDPESLLRAAQVSRKWLDVCKSDKTLRRSARQHVRGAKKRMREEFLGKDLPRRIRKELTRKLRISKSRNVQPVRFQADVVFGKTKQPKMTVESVKTDASFVVRNRKCIRL
ncbi:Probable E3 ubiquitin ligase complex SCF subunit sconB [Anthophora quadrimaculata]